MGASPNTHTHTLHVQSLHNLVIICRGHNARQAEGKRVARLPSIRKGVGSRVVPSSLEARGKLCGHALQVRRVLRLAQRRCQLDTLKEVGDVAKASRVVHANLGAQHDFEMVLSSSVVARVWQKSCQQ